MRKAANIKITNKNKSKTKMVTGYLREIFSAESFIKGNIPMIATKKVVRTKFESIRRNISREKISVEL